MNPKRFMLLACVALAGCSESAKPDNSDPPAAPAAAGEDAAELKAEQKNIEEAADAAAKLVEDEAREEIGQLKSDTSE